MASSLYHKILRVSSLMVALVLLLDSGLLGTDTELLSLRTRQYIATAVGVSASIEPTELNQYTAALTEKERELAAREAALREREIDAGARDLSGGVADYSSYILSALLFVILVLIVVNYILDWARARKNTLPYADPA